MQSLLKYWPLGYFKKAPKNCENETKVGDSNILRALLCWESKVMALQSLLIWEDPKCTVVGYVIYTVLFWCINLINSSLVTKVSIIILILFISIEWVTLIWPEISVIHEAEEDWTTLHPNILSIHELSIHIDNIYAKVVLLISRIVTFRHQYPGFFCCISMGSFFILFTISNIIPGSTLLYIFTTLIGAAPGIICHLLPESFGQAIYNFSCSSAVLDKETTFDEFLPDANSTVIDELLDVDNFCRSDYSDLFEPDLPSSIDRLDCTSSDDSFLPQYIRRPHSEAQTFEEQLVSGLSEGAKIGVTEEREHGTLTWFDSRLLVKMLDRYRNNEPSSDETNDSF